MRHRNAGQFRRRHGTRNPRHHVEAHPGLLQREGFLTAAAEHERIPALQPNDETSTAGGPDHHRMDSGLPQGLAAGPFADEEPLGLSGVPQNSIVNERVVQDQVRRAQAREGLPRQQRRIAGARADKRHMTSMT